LILAIDKVSYNTKISIFYFTDTTDSF